MSGKERIDNATLAILFAMKAPYFIFISINDHNNQTLQQVKSQNIKNQ